MAKGIEAVPSARNNPCRPHDLRWRRGANQTEWQSKLVLLMVLPIAGADLLIEVHGWVEFFWPVALWTLGLSLIFALVVLQLRAGHARGGLWRGGHHSLPAFLHGGYHPQ